MPITIDERRRPIVLVTFVGTATDAEFDQYLRDMTEQILGRRQQTVTILDATRSDNTSAAQRKKQAEWLATHKDDLRRYSLGTAFVIKSAMVRGALTAIFWLQPMDRPHTIVATLDEAEGWAAVKLREAGVSGPR
jgi:hypothetical protein